MIYYSREVEDSDAEFPWYAWREHPRRGYVAIAATEKDMLDHLAETYLQENVRRVWED